MQNLRLLGRRPRVAALAVSGATDVEFRETALVLKLSGFGSAAPMDRDATRVAAAGASIATVAR
jgi:hypothetical protein